MSQKCVSQNVTSDLLSTFFNTEIFLCDFFILSKVHYLLFLNFFLHFIKKFFTWKKSPFLSVADVPVKNKSFFTLFHKIFRITNTSNHIVVKYSLVIVNKIFRKKNHRGIRNQKLGKVKKFQVWVV